MPTTEPMTTGEIARSLQGISSSIGEMRTELKDKPGKEDFNRYREDQNRKHEEQDKALAALESRVNLKDVAQDKAIETVHSRTDKLLYGIIATALGAAANLITNISGG